MENLQILILDDEEKINRKLFNFLKQNGYGAHTARVPQEAFRLLDSNHFDILILDVMLPQMNGLEVLRQVRKTNIMVIFLFMDFSSRQMLCNN